MSISCFNACVKDFNSSELSIDEASCIDRCSLKFFDAYSTINTMIDSTLKRNEMLQNPAMYSNLPH